MKFFTPSQTPCIPKLLVFVGGAGFSPLRRLDGKTLKFSERSGVLKLKRRKRRAPLPTTSVAPSQTALRFSRLSVPRALPRFAA